MVKRRNIDRTQGDVICPPLLPDCQQYLRGVDRGDQMIGYYNGYRCSEKWWKRVWSHVIVCSSLDALSLMKHTKPLERALRGRKKRDFLQSRIELAKELLVLFGAEKGVDEEDQQNVTD